jgi:membrane-associated phospholipid phosphatase
VTDDAAGRLEAPGGLAEPPLIAEAPFGPLVARFDLVADDLLDRVRGHRVADRAMYTLSELGNMGTLWHVAGLSRALLHGRSGWREATRLSSLIGVESLLVNQGIKRLFRRDRPLHEGPRPHTLRTPVTSSFPSGHASSAFFAATLLAPRTKAGTLWYALAALVAVSRPYVRIHHASDVVAGAAVGAGLGWVAKRVWRLP